MSAANDNSEERLQEVLHNLLTTVENLERGVKLCVDVCAGLEARMRALEAAERQRARAEARRPATLYNALGETIVARVKDNALKTTGLT